MNKREALIREQLALNIGGDEKFKIKLFKDIYYSEGIQQMWNLCSAQWLLIDLLSNMVLLRNEHDFVVSKLYKKENESTCRIDYEDGNDKLIKSVSYPFCAFPLTNYIEDGVEKPALVTFYQNQMLYLAQEH